ncbi:hypothetical protein [Devosia sp.]|uniref:hypothetical protein n=1 Tax=Devosia sp. TaxID=1871048 RepID=UPI003A92A916
MPIRPIVPLLAVALSCAMAPAYAESFYTSLDLDQCVVLSVDNEIGGAELRCDGHGGFDVYVSDFDARMSADFGTRDSYSQTFAAFNSVGETIEWLTDDDGVQAAILRYFIDVDGRKAQALVVSKVGVPDQPGCVIGVVDAAVDQSNGVARGIGAMAPVVACDPEGVVVVPGPGGALVTEFSGARR